MDRAGQKGTGKWTVISSLETGVPVSLIGESVFARCLSAMKEERVHASTILEGPNPAANFTAEVHPFRHCHSSDVAAGPVVMYG